MTAIQLEFNINNESPEAQKLTFMQKQINELLESNGKVRRKLFAEVGDMKKQFSALKTENEELRNQLKGLKDEKTEWIYAQGDCLFDVQKA